MSINQLHIYISNETQEGGTCDLESWREGEREGESEDIVSPLSK